MSKDKFYLLVVGSRTFTDYGLLCEKIKYLTANYSDVCIVSGGANGADYLAKKYAEDNGLVYIEFNAQWDVFGKSAGYIRNEKMHEFISRFKNRGCVMFWDGKSAGTKQSIELAKRYNNQLRIIYI